MNKKFLSLVLALVMVLGTFTSVFAAATTTTEVPKATSNEAKIQWLVDNKYVEGRKVNADDKNADLALDKTIQRAEVTKMLVYAIGKQDLAAKLKGVMQPYNDVAPSHWANGFITVGATSPSPANGLPFIHGYKDGSFKPESPVRYDELAKMLVVLVKKDLTAKMVEDAAKSWPTQWMAWAAELGIFEDLTIADSSKDAVRKDAFVMMYNAMYKMEDLRPIPANETLGIISKQSNGTTLVLNQGDFKKDFTVDNDTVFVQAGSNQPATPWIKLVGTDNYYVGSLVRVLTNEKGVVTHIVQLGNPVDGPINNDRAGWMGVADKTNWTGKTGSVTLDDLKDITVNGIKATTNNLTRYFVADVEDGALTEATKEEILTKYFNKSTNTAENVYMGYDNQNGLNQAKVIVFNNVDNGTASSDLVRVVTPGNTLFNLQVEKPGATQTTSYGVNVRDINNIFPLNYNHEKYDVIELTTVDGNYSYAADPVIDHSEADIFAISKVTTKKIDNMFTSPTGYVTYIELVDKNGAKQEFPVEIDLDAFFGNQLKEGAKVQIDKDAETDGRIEVISVIDPNATLRGYLENGTDARQETGVVQGSFDELGELYVVKVLVDGKVNNYVVPSSEAKKFADGALDGVEVTFKVDPAKYQDHGKGYAFDFEKSEAQKAVDAVQAKLSATTGIRIADIKAAGDQATLNILANRVNGITASYNNLTAYQKALDAANATETSASIGDQLQAKVDALTARDAEVAPDEALNPAVIAVQK